MPEILPFTLLQDIERRAHRTALGLPDAEAVDETWAGIGLRLGEGLLVTPVDDVQEVLNVPQMTPVPATRGWLLGVANVRGHLTSVVDLNGFLSATPTRLLPRSRLLVIYRQDIWIGLLVDEVYGLRHLEPAGYRSDWQPASDGLRPFVRGGFRSRDRDWALLDLPSLVASQRFQEVTL